jgi:hypothetical protein
MDFISYRASRIYWIFSFGRSPACQAIANLNKRRLEESAQTPPSEMRYALQWMSQLNEFHIQQDKYFTG